MCVFGLSKRQDMERKVSRRQDIHGFCLSSWTYRSHSSDLVGMFLFESQKT